jgi:hypothetical protein
VVILKLHAIVLSSWISIANINNMPSFEQINRIGRIKNYQSASPMSNTGIFTCTSSPNYRSCTFAPSHCNDRNTFISVF